jgi:hypothetical protein
MKRGDSEGMPADSIAGIVAYARLKGL